MCRRNAGGSSWGIRNYSQTILGRLAKTSSAKCRPAGLLARHAGNTPDGGRTVGRSSGGLSGIEWVQEGPQANYRSFYMPTLPNGTTKLSQLQPDGKLLSLTEIPTRSWSTTAAVPASLIRLRILLAPQPQSSRESRELVGCQWWLQRARSSGPLKLTRGRKHTFLIPGSYLAPGAPGRLLSPQHWSKVTGSNTWDTKGTWQATYDDKVVLHWNENTSQQSVLLDPFTNVATIRLAPGNKAFRIYKAMMDAQGGESDPICFNANIVDTTMKRCGSRGERAQFRQFRQCQLHQPQTQQWDKRWTGPLKAQATWRSTSPIDFGDIKGQSVKNEGQDDVENAMTPTAELLQTHYWLSHLSFATIQAMAKRGDLLSRLADCRIPKCTSCLYGKATKWPWQNKPSGKFESKIRIATKPGEVISVDQLESPTPGLYGQLKGAATGKRYRAATIFVDHYSRFLFCYLQESLTSADTLWRQSTYLNSFVGPMECKYCTIMPTMGDLPTMRLSVMFLPNGKKLHTAE